MTATSGVLVVVILLVLTYFFRCLHLIRSDDASGRFRALRRRLVGDIGERVASGRNLDWVYYSDEAQRKHEDLREHLHNYGTIALATGVGGTMGALALHLLVGDAPQGDALGALLGEMGWALVASGTGVLGNLAILWVLLPLANRRFNPQFDHFLDELGKAEKELRSQAETPSQSTAEIIGNRLGEELRSAVAHVPKMFEQLGETATVLGEATEKLDADVTTLTSTTGTLVRSTSSLQSTIERASAKHDEAVGNLSDSGREVATSVNDAAAKLSERTLAVQESVEGLPGLLASAVERSGEPLGRKLSDAIEPHVTGFRDGVADGLEKTIEWQNVVTEHLNEAQRQHRRAVHDLVTRTADVVTKVDGLPGAISEGVEEVSDKLGREFGHQARQHVAQLRTILHEDAQELQRRLQRHESHLLNTTVQELRNVSEKLINRTVRDLEGISEKLVAVLNGFPEHVAAVNTSLGDAEGELRDIVARMEKTSSTLRSAHDKTGDMLAGLVRSTEDLAQVIRQFAEVHAQAIRELAKALPKPRRKGWSWRFWRRSHEGTPSATTGQGAA